jgi:hypothetical protein
VVQGSSVGPSAFIITASDLHPVTIGNEMKKYADDMYVIIPASNNDSCQLEIDNVSNWAAANNLQINKSKSEEIIFTRKGAHGRVILPPPLPDLKRVDTIKGCDTKDRNSKDRNSYDRKNKTENSNDRKLI